VLKITGLKTKGMKKIMHMLFLSCLKATELIEKRMHFKLSFIEKMKLKAHKIMCRSCASYEKQSFLLEKGISKSLRTELNKENLLQLKQQIQKKLKELE
jgi:hypothetical protein